MYVVHETPAIIVVVCDQCNSSIILGYIYLVFVGLCEACVYQIIFKKGLYLFVMTFFPVVFKEMFKKSGIVVDVDHSKDC